MQRETTTKMFLGLALPLLVTAGCKSTHHSVLDQVKQPIFSSASLGASCSLVEPEKLDELYKLAKSNPAPAALAMIKTVQVMQAPDKVAWPTSWRLANFTELGLTQEQRRLLSQLGNCSAHTIISQGGSRDQLSALLFAGYQAAAPLKLMELPGAPALTQLVLTHPAGFHLSVALVASGENLTEAQVITILRMGLYQAKKRKLPARVVERHIRRALLLAQQPTIASHFLSDPRPRVKPGADISDFGVHRFCELTKDEDAYASRALFVELLPATDAGKQTFLADFARHKQLRLIIRSLYHDQIDRITTNTCAGLALN